MLRRERGRGRVGSLRRLTQYERSFAASATIRDQEQGSPSPQPVTRACVLYRPGQALRPCNPCIGAASGREGKWMRRHSLYIGSCGARARTRRGRRSLCSGSSGVRARIWPNPRIPYTGSCGVGGRRRQSRHTPCIGSCGARARTLRVRRSLCSRSSGVRAHTCPNRRILDTCSCGVGGSRRQRCRTPCTYCGHGCASRLQTRNILYTTSLAGCARRSKALRT